MSERLSPNEQPCCGETDSEGLAETDTTGEQDSAGDLGAELERVRTEGEELLDKYRRQAAEFANFRKRQVRDREQREADMTMALLRKLLPVIDDLGRALSDVPDAVRGTQWAEGIQLIDRKLAGILESYGVAPIEAAGELFDPHYHEALMQTPNESVPAGTVVDEVQKGYTLGDRVLRATLVTVSGGAAQDAAD